MKSSSVGNLRVDKRGLVSNFISFFGATILIVLILTVFVFGAGVVKKLNNAGSDVAVFNESKVEIDNIFDYSERYVLLSKVRFSVANKEDLDSALDEMEKSIILKKKIVLPENIA